ncbi:MAG: hypothetical protein M3P48_04970 [Actinomycetota bacterium]|nr:hypothetical protein [Actinomycetota bacterium]
MPCNPLIPATCADEVVNRGAGAVGDAAAASLGNSFADAMRDGATWVIATTIGWWVDVPSIDLSAAPVAEIRGYVWWLAIVIAVAGVTWQGLRMAITRKPDPLFDIGRGLFTLAVWAGIGVIGPAMTLRAGDSFASWALDEAARGQVADRLVALASLAGVQSAGAAILLGLLMMLTGLLQAVLMMFREGAVVILAGVVVLAAAGNFTGFGRPWLMKVLGWMLALICYKPVAALVYAVALTLVGEGKDPRTIVVGLSMIAMSIFALPVLMKFFTWATGQASGGGGGAAALAGVSAAGIHAAAAMHGRAGGDAATQAGHIRQDLGPPVGAPSGGRFSGAPPSPASGTQTPAGAGAGAGAGSGTSATGGQFAAGGPAGGGAGTAGAAAATGGAAVAVLAATGAADAAKGASHSAGDAMGKGER